MCALLHGAAGVWGSDSCAYQTCDALCPVLVRDVVVHADADCGLIELDQDSVSHTQRDTNRYTQRVSKLYLLSRYLLDHILYHKYMRICGPLGRLSECCEIGLGHHHCKNLPSL